MGSELSPYQLRVLRLMIDTQTTLAGMWDGGEFITPLAAGVYATTTEQREGRPDPKTDPTPGQRAAVFRAFCSLVDYGYVRRAKKVTDYPRVTRSGMAYVRRHT